MMSYPKFNTMDNSKTQGSNLEWETVRRKKNPPAAAGGGGGGDDSKKYENIELNENYTPRIIRDKIFDILNSSDNTQSKINTASKEIGKLMAQRKKDEAEEARKRTGVTCPLCKTGDINLPKSEIKVAYFADDGNTKICKDKYDAYLYQYEPQDVLAALKEANKAYVTKDNPRGYRRLAMAIALLESSIPDFGNQMKVTFFGH